MLLGDGYRTVFGIKFNSGIHRFFRQEGDIVRHRASTYVFGRYSIIFLVTGHRSFFQFGAWRINR